MNTEPDKDSNPLHTYEIKKNDYEKRLMERLRYNIDDLTVKLERANMKYHESEYKAKLAEERKQNYEEVSHIY